MTTSGEHFLHLAEFVRGVELAGGTTPHVAMTVESMRSLDDPLEKLWFAGCYCLVYNWPAAERIFLEWRPGDFDQVEFLMWLEEHHDGLPLRKERKAVYRRPLFAESAASYLEFSRWLLSQDSWPESYGEAFDTFTSRCRYMGRYIAVRWLEVMRRAFGTGWAMTDIRSDGGEHPRKALALVFPERALALLGGNSRAEVAVSDAAADDLVAGLSVVYGLETDYYEVQSLLCEYKQSALGRKQYPGKSIDTEMDYFDRVYRHWPAEDRERSAFYDVRRACFPEWSLGETRGWRGVRQGLCGVLVDHGYTWSDAVYDYPATVNLAAPILRPGAEALL